MSKNVRLPLLILLVLQLLFGLEGTMVSAQELTGEPVDKVSRRLDQFWQRMDDDGFSRSEVARFSGFYEGVTSVRVPEWWEEQLYAISNGKVSASTPVNKTLTVRQLESQLQHPKTSVILDFRDRSHPARQPAKGQRRKSLVVLDADGHEFRFQVVGSESEFELVVFPNEESLYIIELKHISDTYEVFKYSKSRRAVDWSRSINMRQIFGGPDQHTIDLVADASSDCVTVFGVLASHVYTVSLDLESGVIKWRFACQLRSDPNEPLFRVGDDRPTESNKIKY